MNIVLMCFVCFFLFSYAAVLNLAAVNFHIENINLKKMFFSYPGGAMPCLVAQHPQMPGA